MQLTMIRDKALSALAQALGMQYSCEKATVANLGVQNEICWSEELQMWCGPKDEPPLPKKVVSSGGSATTMAPPTAVDLLTAPPKLHLNLRGQQNLKCHMPDPTSLPVARSLEPAAPPRARLPEKGDVHGNNSGDQCRLARNDLGDQHSSHSEIGEGGAAVSWAGSHKAPLACTRQSGLAQLCGDVSHLRLRVSEARRAHIAGEARDWAHDILARLYSDCGWEPEPGAVHEIGECLGAMLKTRQSVDHAGVAPSMKLLWGWSFRTDCVDQLTSGIVEHVVEVMRESADCPRMLTSCCGVLLNAATIQAGRAAIVRAGGPAVITSAMSSHMGDDIFMQMGCCALYILARFQDARTSAFDRYLADAAKMATASSGVIWWGWQLREMLDYRIS